LTGEATIIAANEFQRILMSILSRHGMSISNLAEHTGYNLYLLENIIAGKSRQMPADFFVRIANVLNLDTEEKDALVRSWAFGIERLGWRIT
jgi:predicted transcriptional regulator